MKCSTHMICCKGRFISGWISIYLKAPQFGDVLHDVPSHPQALIEMVELVS